MRRALASTVVTVLSWLWFPVWLVGHVVLYLIGSFVMLLSLVTPWHEEVAEFWGGAIESWGEWSAAPLDALGRAISGDPDFW